MPNTENKDRLYIVISQTGTILSRILKHITGAEYNHVSLALKPDLNTLYSFGRKFAYNPFAAGFVVESPHWGTFKRFSKTKVIVLALDVDRDTYKNIHSYVNYMMTNRSLYRYNYLGLIFAYFKKQKAYENRYYCSEFLKYVLQKFSIEGADKLAPIVQPIHFLDIPKTEQIYTGTLKEYKSFYCDNTKISV